MMNTFCVCPELSLDVIEKIGSLLFGFVTLIIIILGYRKFLQNQLRNKQLDVVTELVGQIQQVDWQYLHFNKFDNLPSKQSLATIFDIAEMKEFDECENLFFWGEDTEQNDEMLITWAFFDKYYSHPFLPISIAEALKKFSFWNEQKEIPYKDAQSKKYIAFGRKKWVSENAHFFYLVEGEMTSCKKFKQLAKELRDAIIKWAKKYGIADLNITKSHRSIMNKK